MDDVSQSEMGEVRGERWATCIITIKYCRTLSNNVDVDFSFMTSPGLSETH